MAFESSVIVGSGVSALREPQPSGQNVPRMRGTNSVVINYEDINSVLGVAQSTAVNITGTAAQLTPPATRLRGRRKMIITNGATEIFIGGANVTSSNGLPLAADATLELDVLDVGDLYAVTGGGSSDVRILELR